MTITIPCQHWHRLDFKRGTCNIGAYHNPIHAICLTGCPHFDGPLRERRRLAQETDAHTSLQVSAPHQTTKGKSGCGIIRWPPPLNLRWHGTPYPLRLIYRPRTLPPPLSGGLFNETFSGCGCLVWLLVKWRAIKLACKLIRSAR